MGTTKEVLVVDDDSDIRDAIAQILEFEGYSVKTAANGVDGLAQLKNIKPSLILLDLMMPVMNGLQFKLQIDADPTLAQIPVIVLSADSNPQQRSNGMKADGFLKKPVQLETLLETVKKYC